jgi:hypothetical protein
MVIKDRFCNALFNVAVAAVNDGIQRMENGNDRRSKEIYRTDAVEIGRPG